MPPLPPGVSKVGLVKGYGGWNNSSSSRRSNTIRGLLSTRTPHSTKNTGGGIINASLGIGVIKEAMPKGASGSWAPRPISLSRSSQITLISQAEWLNVVDAWLAGGEDRQTVEAQYGRIEDWNTSLITNMAQTFDASRNPSAAGFDAYIKNWDTQNVTDMSAMFSDASDFTGLDIGSWVTSSVRNMKGMFAGATDFNAAIGAWRTEQVQDMEGMFSGAESFNQDIGSWDTSNVTDMGAMFSNASDFNQDLSSWCVERITSQPTNFDAGATSWTTPNSRPPWGAVCT
jgi:surface protein